MDKVFEKGKYFIVQKSRPMDNEKLYLVYVDGTFWRDKMSKYANVNLQKCIDWVNARRCFKNSLIAEV